MRRTRLAILIATATALSGLFVSGGGVAQAASSTQICSRNTASSPEYCFNREGGHTSSLTSVIAWHSGDGNNTFQYNQLTSMCNHGRATTTCPFQVGSGLNDAYNNDEIVDIQSQAGGLCVGGEFSTSPDASLTGCPNSAGNGGGWSTIDVLVPSAAGFNVIINRNESNMSYNAGFCHGTECAQNLIEDGLGQAIFLGGGDSGIQSGDPAGSCGCSQWNQGPL